ncbi:MAG: hypothetical protein MZV63_19440 [Marinilabiliales bacterium]|nr:hypothetical protein [Marinilabiliales bacterium]
MTTTGQSGVTVAVVQSPPVHRHAEEAGCAQGFDVAGSVPPDGGGCPPRGHRCRTRSGPAASVCAPVQRP